MTQAIGSELFADGNSKCGNFVLRLAEYDLESASKLASKSSSSQVQVFKADGVAAKLIPMPKDPMIEFKENLEAAIKEDDILLDDGYTVQITPKDSTNGEEILAKFVHSNPKPAGHRTGDIRPEDLSRGPYELPWYYDRTSDELPLRRHFRDASIYGGFQSVHGLKYSIKFEERGENLTATLIVKTTDGTAYPFVTYQIPKTELKGNSPFSISDIAWETNIESDRALRAIGHSPSFFWLDLKTTTIRILKDSAKYWLKNRIKSKAA